ncbi:4168_t:CDS:2, partial [Gigaspora rosea]
LKIKLDTKPIDSNNKFLKHKTTNREYYNEARQRLGLGPTPGSDDPIFDVLLYNDQNEITECSSFNIAVQFFDENGTSYWKTPPIECGLLKGVYRGKLITDEKIIDEKIIDEVITVEEIKQAQRDGRKIKCFDSVMKDFYV